MSQLQKPFGFGLVKIETVYTYNFNAPHDKRFKTLKGYLRKKGYVVQYNGEAEYFRHRYQAEEEREKILDALTSKV